MTLTLTSPAFVSAESAGSASAQAGSSSIPPRFAMRAVPGGHNISIPYVWRDAPASTASFALALIDTAPVAHDWVHWLVVGIPASTTALGEAASGGAAMPSGAVELRNSFGATGYGGPQPPIGTGQHPYVATIFALDVRELGVPASASLADVERAMRGHVLASATCTGHFGR